MIIGTHYYEVEYAVYECLIEICLDIMAKPLELGCTYKRGKEKYWVTVNMESIIKTERGSLNELEEYRPSF